MVTKKKKAGKAASCRAASGGAVGGKRTSNRLPSKNESSDERLLAALGATEAELRIKNEVFHASIASQSIADAEGIITHVNRTFLEMWGYPDAKSAVGNSVGSFFVNTEDAQPVLGALAEHDAWAGEFLAKRADGTTFISRGYATALRDAEGKLTGYQSTNLDVTAERETESALRDRVKELRCMQQISEVIEREGTDTEQVLREAVAALAVSLQYPVDTVVRIRLGDEVHQNGELDRCAATLAAEIRASDGVGGKVEVGLRGEHSERDQGPFLSEERKLVDSVAEMLSIYMGRRAAQQALLQHQQELKQQVRERTVELEQSNEELRQQALLETAQAELSVRMAGDPSMERLGGNVIGYICDRLQVPMGLFYTATAEGRLELAGGYAHKTRAGASYSFAPGEGLVGQAAQKKKAITLTDVPESYFAIESGLGKMLPRIVHLQPIVREGRVRAVLELGLRQQLDDFGSRFLKEVSESIALAVESARARETQARLLEQSQAMTEELRTQQEELKAANEELEEQAQRLRDSQARLKAQQEQLQVTNEELEEKTELLVRQKREVELARKEISEKAEALALASKYKSEFLANMSHELRTPLNSLLLLSRSLSENKPGNLSPEQVESAGLIYQGGNDLLSLINEILDLSKIEAGRMELRFGDVYPADVAASLSAAFERVAGERGIALQVAIEPGTPERFTSDRQRVEQVLKNLVGNAVKFTESGRVAITFAVAGADDAGRLSRLRPDQALRVSVSDTGIGIPPDKQKVIFEAFQQAEGGTARKYGGTGLGLSIVRELTRILGGEIHLQSEPGRGSTFTVYLPLQRPATESELRALPHEPEVEHDRPSPPVLVPVSLVADDRAEIQKGDRSILIIEDDVRFAAALARQCREQGFKVLAATTGEEGIDLARRFHPGGILLDLKLPGIDGWRALELLKEDPETRHIPVHIASAQEREAAAARRKGAIGFLQKPLTAEQIGEALDRLDRTAAGKTKRVLVVEDDEHTRRGIVELIADKDVEVDEMAGGAEAIEALRSRTYDCMVLDLGLWDFDGDELLGRAERDESIELPPVIVYTGRDLTWQQDLHLRSFSDSVIIKGVRSDERLLDEVSLFLHRVVADMPEKKRQVIASLHDVDALLRDKKVLLVDDDMRTLFALTRILAERGMRVLKAENGQKALELLEREPDVNLALMDIMMPVLDGYQTIERIRAQQRFAKLPIIALTAKVMPGDQQRCLEAGASDYLPKPVDRDRLISMLRVWLYR